MSGIKYDNGKPSFQRGTSAVNEQEIREKFTYMFREILSAWAGLGQQMEVLLKWDRAVPHETKLQEAIDDFSNLEYDLTGDCDLSVCIAQETRSWEVSDVHKAWVDENYSVIVGSGRPEDAHLFAEEPKATAKRVAPKKAAPNKALITRSPMQTPGGHRR